MVTQQTLTKNLQNSHTHYINQFETLYQTLEPDIDTLYTPKPKFER